MKLIKYIILFVDFAVAIPGADQVSRPFSSALAQLTTTKLLEERSCTHSSSPPIP
jgi:hypothetical protein